MPFKIVRNSITKVKADIIVNTANPKPVHGGGTDTAIYMAAGEEDLLNARREIGMIARGDIAVTPGFNLKAQYIIHAVGPIWRDGEHGEFDILRSCYEKSLRKAEELGVNSIAFPLMASGVNGFPKDKALMIAESVIREFLRESELTILLVVFDKESFQLSEEFATRVYSYIDDDAVSEQAEKEYSKKNQRYYEKNYGDIINVEDENMKDDSSFSDKLLQYINLSGMKNADVYRKANMDRRIFSKIINPKNEYHLSKESVMCLCYALQLDFEQAKDLLARADWTFNPNKPLDVCMRDLFKTGKYTVFNDMIELNKYLFAKTGEALYDPE